MISSHLHADTSVSFESQWSSTFWSRASPPAYHTVKAYNNLKEESRCLYVLFVQTRQFILASSGTALHRRLVGVDILHSKRHGLALLLLLRLALHQSPILIVDIRLELPCCHDPMYPGFRAAKPF